MENRCFASYYSCRSLAIEPKRWITGQRRNREDSRVPPAQSTLSETPVEEAEFIVLNVAGLCLGRAEYRDLHGCGRSKVRGWSCGSEFMAAYVCGRERGTPFQVIVELCSKSSPFTITTRSGVPCAMLAGRSRQSTSSRRNPPKLRNAEQRRLREYTNSLEWLCVSPGGPRVASSLCSNRGKLGSWCALPLG
jgi:hypothetical protein